MVGYFYGLLFVEHPKLRALFPAAMDVQRDRLFRSLTRIVWGLDSPNDFAPYLEQLGRDHLKFGIRPEHYGAFGRALVAAIRRYAGDVWGPETEAAWYATYQMAADIMIRAAQRAEQHGASRWTGEVVAHDRRTPDIAVVTVRPDRRLPYDAGQHVSVETRRWPQVWRRYSIANAPRDDGTVDLHVRAVPAGWVSGALVRHTDVGDRVRMGPADGAMVPDGSPERDVLCVAGGTGLAPIKAIVEERARARHGGRVHLFFGARQEDDLYDLPELRRLEGAHPRLRVVPVVSHDPAYPGAQGMVADVVARDRSWADHDVFVSGPEQMVFATVTRLQDADVPLARILHDADSDTVVSLGAAEPVPAVGAG